MAVKKQEWTKLALDQWHAYLCYWDGITGSRLYSRKLDKQVAASIKLLTEQPFLGNL